MTDDNIAGERQSRLDPRYSDRSPPLSGKDLLDLYIFQQTRGDETLKVEREIVIRNYTVLGAVLLIQSGAQGGFLASILPPETLAILSGIFLIVVSIASRVMSVFYAKYTLALFVDAKILRKTVIRGRNSLYAEEKARERNLTKLNRAAEQFSWRSFFSDTGALAAINLFPGVIGLVLLFYGLITTFKCVNDLWPGRE